MLLDSKFEFDEKFVTIRFTSHQSLIDRVKSLFGGKEKEPVNKLGMILADLRAEAELLGQELEIEHNYIRLRHQTFSSLSSETANALGLPPLVELTLRTNVTGNLGSENFKLTHEWIRAGRKEPTTRTGAVLWTTGLGFDGYRRIPLAIYDALEVADRFRSEADLAEHWVALARFRQSLTQTSLTRSDDEGSRIVMTEFLKDLRVTIADRFSISPTKADRFDIVPFSGEVVDEATRSGGQVSETNSELHGNELENFQSRVEERGALPAFRLGQQQHYLVVSPDAVPVLDVMARMQQADRETRKDFINNPRPHITEAITKHLRKQGRLIGLTPEQEEEVLESVADPLLVETAEYSDRVIGLTRYQAPEEFLQEEFSTTWLPEIFSEEEFEYISKLPEKSVKTLIRKVDQAIASDTPSVIFEGQKITAGQRVRGALKIRLNQLQLETIRATNKPNNAAAEALILDTKQNLEELRWFFCVNKRQEPELRDVPDVVKTELKDHQNLGLQWMIDAWVAGLPGVLNADEQGLGKTLQAISFLAWNKENMGSQNNREKSGPVLVVAPTSLLKTWEAEVETHMNAPRLGNVIRLYGSELGSKRIRGQSGVEIHSGEEMLDLSEVTSAMEEGRGHEYWILTTYTTLTNYQLSLAKIKFSTAVFDEIQAFKNLYSLRAKAGLTVNADFKIGLTGTPIENSTTDLWAIMEQLTPGYLGALDTFKSKYKVPSSSNMRELYQKVFTEQSKQPPLALRRLKEEVARDLPAKNRFIHPRVMPVFQAAAYEYAKHMFSEKTHGNALKRLQHIRSVSVHPDLATHSNDSEFVDMSARLQATMDTLKFVQSRGEKVLVFIEHVKMQHRFLELVKNTFKLAFVHLINGQTPIPRRQQIVDDFQSSHLSLPGTFQVLVLSPRAAGTGLTLTAATHVIHLSRWWNPAVEEQCNDRVHRIGQTKDVTIHIPMAIHDQYGQDSFDCHLHSLMNRKRRLASAALWPMGDTTTDIDDLQHSIANSIKSEQASNPVKEAVTEMFARDQVPLPPENQDGSYHYS